MAKANGGRLADHTSDTPRDAPDGVAGDAEGLTVAAPESLESALPGALVSRMIDPVAAVAAGAGLWLSKSKPMPRAWARPLAADSA